MPLHVHVWLGACGAILRACNFSLGVASGCPVVPSRFWCLTDITWSWIGACSCAKGNSCHASFLTVRAGFTLFIFLCFCSRSCVRSAGFADFLPCFPMCFVSRLASAWRGALAVLSHAHAHVRALCSAQSICGVHVLHCVLVVYVVLHVCLWFVL